MLEIVGLGSVIVGLMKVNENSHNLANMQATTPSASKTDREHLLVSVREDGLTKVVDMTEKFE
jgi:hypothetical protein